MQCGDTYLRYWKEDLEAGNNDKNKIYFQLGRNNGDTPGSCFWHQFQYPNYMAFSFVPGKTMMRFFGSENRTDVPVDFSVWTDKFKVEQNQTIINNTLKLNAAVESSDSFDIGVNIVCGGTATVDKYLHIKDNILFGPASTVNPRALIRYTTHYSGGAPIPNPYMEFGNHAGNRMMLYNDGELKINGGLTTTGNITANNDVNVSGDLYVKGVKIDNLEIPSTIDKDLTITKSLTIDSVLRVNNFTYTKDLYFTHSKGAMKLVAEEGDLQWVWVPKDGSAPSSGSLINTETTVEIPSTIDKNLTVNGLLTANSSEILGSATVNKSLVVKEGFTVKSLTSLDGDTTIGGTLYVSNKDANFLQNVKVSKKLIVNGTEITGNQTILHKTDVISGEPGTFCETNGGIYTGYDKIDTTDCICQVQQSTTLNTKIVGIITSSDHFASHGDVLVKIVPGTYHLGDILCPDISGKARKATETELQFMMLHAIPRAKITSLDTKIEGTVACFIV